MMTPLDLTCACPECLGKGAVESLDWQEWHDCWWEAYGLAIEAGKPFPVGIADKTAGPPPDEPELVVCPACDGRGWLRTRFGREVAVGCN